MTNIETIEDYLNFMNKIYASKAKKLIKVGKIKEAKELYNEWISSEERNAVIDTIIKIKEIEVNSITIIINKDDPRILL